MSLFNLIDFSMIFTIIHTYFKIVHILVSKATIVLGRHATVFVTTTAGLQFLHSAEFPMAAGRAKMAVEAVKIEADAYMVCLTHALTTEREEVMGLLIGEVFFLTSLHF